jgi:signal peptidase
MNTARLRLAHRVLTWVATLAAAALLVSVSLLFGLPRLLGWDLVVVQSGSMEPALPVGSLMFVEPAEPEAVAVGDIVSYRPPHERDPNIRVTHRVVGVLQQEGSLAFRTKGDANEDPDTYLVPVDNVEGKVGWHVPWLGYIAQRLRTPMGFLGLILLPGGIIILTEARNIFRQLRGGGQGGGSGGRPRERGEPRKSRRLLWLTVLGVMAFGAVVGALRRPAER